MTSAPQTARAIARRELTTAIVGRARQQLAEVGPAQLSVRQIARDLGMASSAVYRYFPSRDELLTELLVVIYHELADRLELADAAVDPDDRSARWRTLAHTFRAWSTAAPHEFALLYGSPVPGYAAPRQTVGPASRVTGVLIALAAAVDAAGVVPTTALPAGAHETLSDFRTAAGVDLSDEVVLRTVTAWGGLLGAVTLELFGHLHRAVTDFDAHFDLVIGRLDPTG
ncbi:TetR/AcrR family transcriptional regulator [Nakamurella sp.]|uniref:TetR/AcrR family transcriptional regulator n=1 Tax=Nakamurella sp. TaxID=1869182 RepID=UPI003B3A1D0F